MPPIPVAAVVPVQAKTNRAVYTVFSAGGSSLKLVSGSAGPLVGPCADLADDSPPGGNGRRSNFYQKSLQESHRGMRSGTMQVYNAKAENRIERRLKVFLRIEMKMKSQCHPAHLLDVSPNGAQVYCEYPIEVGARVSLKYRDISCPAKCVRAQASRIGLRFISPLQSSQLNLLLSGR